MDNFFLQNDPQFTQKQAAPGAGADANFFLQNDPQFVQKQTFVQKVGSDIDKRVNLGHEIVNSDLNPAVKTLAYVGKVGGGLARDVIGDAIPQPVKDAAAGALDLATAGANYLPGFKSYSKAMGETVQGAQNVYDKFNPNVKAALEGAGNIVGLAGDMAGAEGLASGVRGGLNAASDAMPGMKPVGKAAAAAAPKTSISRGLFDEGDKAYRDANTSGAGGTGQAVNNFLEQANQNAAQDPILMQTHGVDDAQKYLQNLNALKDKPLPISTAQKFDIDLREKASKAYRAGDNSLGARYNAIRDALRAHIYNNPDPSLMTGGAEGFKALQEGNRLYSQGYKAEQIENMMSDAMEKGNTPTVIKNTFAKLSKNIRDKGPQGWSDDQIALIEHAAQTGSVTGLLSAMGNKIVSPAVGGIVAGTAGGLMAGPVGAAVGSTLGSGAGYVAGAPFRAAATALQRSRANAVLNSIADNPVYNRAVPVPRPGMKMLPAPGEGVNFYADEMGNISRTPNPAHEVVQGGAPADIRGVPVQPQAQPGFPAQPLALPPPSAYDGFQVDSLGNVISKQGPGVVGTGGIISPAELARMKPADALKYLNLRSKK